MENLFEEVRMKELKDVLPVGIQSFRQQKLIMDDKLINGRYGKEDKCLQNLLQGWTMSLRDQSEKAKEKLFKINK